MKRRVFIGWAIGMAWCGLGHGFAAAQLGQYAPPQVRQRPAVSPYVNLGAGGGAIDYYGIVRPQIEAGQAMNQLQFGLTHLPDGTTPLNNLLPQNQVNALGGLQTGHPVSYNNYQRFFPLTAGTVSAMPGTPGYGVPGYGQTGFGVPGYGQAGYGQAGLGQTGFGAGAAGRTFFPATMGPTQLR